MSKTILITGASSGFGEATAHVFAELGWRLIVLARRESRLKELTKTLVERHQADVHELVCDVRDEDRLYSLLNQLPKSHAHVDVLVNNAGLALGLSPAHLADLNDWQTMIDTNITALVNITRHLLPGMVDRNQGHIVNMGSVAGNWPYPSGNVYGASKAFVKQFSNNLLADLSGTNVRVTNIEPGLAKTEFSDVRFHGDKAKAKQVYRWTEPLKAEDIAEVVRWVVMQPAHVNINAVEVMPVCQSFEAFKIHRKQ